MTSHSQIHSLLFSCIIFSFFKSQNQGDAPWGDGDEAQPPACPKQCLIQSRINGVLNQIKFNGAILSEDSCGTFNHTLSYDVFHFNYHYPENNSDPNKVHRMLQSLEGGGPITIPPVEPGSGGMPPGDGFKQTNFGWNIEISNDADEGYCIIQPNGIVGPFAKGALMTCIHELEFACYRVETEPPVTKENACPCFDLAEVESIQKSLQAIDVNQFEETGTYEAAKPLRPILDLVKSCKEPGDNNDLPYGIYYKNSKESIVRGETHTVQIGVKFVPDDGETQTKCYEGSASPFLTDAQQSSCIELVDNLCGSLKTMPNRYSCSDDTEFRRKNNTWASCENIFSDVDNLGSEERERICNKYDKDASAFVFEKCRKSCRKCTCSDSASFAFNGQEAYGCRWLAKLSNDERETLCQDDDVATSCPIACRTGCCQNKDTFFKVKADGRGGKKRKRNRITCDDIGNSNWKEMCQSKRIARNCPMKCRKCFIQPRS